VPPVAPLELVGSRLTVRLATQAFYEDSDRPVGLSLELLSSDGTPISVPLGPLPHGSVTLPPVRVPIDCAAACVVTGWKVETDPSNVGFGRVVIGPLRTDRSGRLPWGGRSDWRKSGGSGAGMEALSVSSRALTVFVNNPGGSAEQLLAHAWVPGSLPALVSGSLPPDSRGRSYEAAGLDGVNRAMTAAARVPWLPAAGRNASVSDLGLAARSGALLDDDAVLQVWTSRSDAKTRARLTAALEHQRLVVTHVARTADARHRLDDSATSWSLLLGILVGGACLLVAALGLAVAGAASWRPRARDLAILRLNGVGVADLRWIAVGEQLPTIPVAVVAGTATGVLAAHFALPSLPLLPHDPQVDLIDLSPAWPIVLTVGAVSLAVLCAVGAVVAWLVERRAGSERAVGSP
jgi:hypothetical protein